jgi:hypothetical protein
VAPADTERTSVRHGACLKIEARWPRVLEKVRLRTLTKHLSPILLSVLSLTLSGCASYHGSHHGHGGHLSGIRVSNNDYVHDHHHHDYDQRDSVYDHGLGNYYRGKNRFFWFDRDGRQRSGSNHSYRAQKARSPAFSSSRAKIERSESKRRAFLDRKDFERARWGQQPPGRAWKSSRLGG